MGSGSSSEYSQVPTEDEMEAGENGRRGRGSGTGSGSGKRRKRVNIHKQANWENVRTVPSYFDSDDGEDELPDFFNRGLGDEPTDWPRSCPVLHLDISNDFQLEKQQADCRSLYRQWIFVFWALVLNFVGVMAAQLTSNVTNPETIVVSFVFAIVQLFGYFLLYFRVFYWALRLQSHALFIWFYLVSVALLGLYAFIITQGVSLMSILVVPLAPGSQLPVKANPVFPMIVMALVLAFFCFEVLMTIYFISAAFKWQFMSDEDRMSMLRKQARQNWMSKFFGGKAGGGDDDEDEYDDPDHPEKGKTFPCILHYDPTKDFHRARNKSRNKSKNKTTSNNSSSSSTKKKKKKKTKSGTVAPANAPPPQVYDNSHIPDEVSIPGKIVITDDFATFRADEPVYDHVFKIRVPLHMIKAVQKKKTTEVVIVEVKHEEIPEENENAYTQKPPGCFTKASLEREILFDFEFKAKRDKFAKYVTQRWRKAKQIVEAEGGTQTKESLRNARYRLLQQNIKRARDHLLTHKDWQLLAASCWQEVYRSGETVFDVDKCFDAMYHVTGGELSVMLDTTIRTENEEDDDEANERMVEADEVAATGGGGGGGGSSSINRNSPRKEGDPKGSAKQLLFPDEPSKEIYEPGFRYIYPMDKDNCFKANFQSVQDMGLVFKKRKRLQKPELPRVNNPNAPLPQELDNKVPRFVVTKSPPPGTQAHLAGIKVGDEIVKIAGADVEAGNFTQKDVKNKIFEARLPLQIVLRRFGKGDGTLVNAPLPAKEEGNVNAANPADNATEPEHLADDNATAVESSRDSVNAGSEDATILGEDGTDSGTIVGHGSNAMRSPPTGRSFATQGETSTVMDPNSSFAQDVEIDLNSDDDDDGGGGGDDVDVSDGDEDDDDDLVELELAEKRAAREAALEDSDDEDGDSFGGLKEQKSAGPYSEHSLREIVVDTPQGSAKQKQTFPFQQQRDARSSTTASFDQLAQGDNGAKTMSQKGDTRKASSPQDDGNDEEVFNARVGLVSNVRAFLFGQPLKNVTYNRVHVGDEEVMVERSKTGKHRDRLVARKDREADELSYDVGDEDEDEDEDGGGGGGDGDDDIDGDDDGGDDVSDDGSGDALDNLGGFEEADRFKSGDIIGLEAWIVNHPVRVARIDAATDVTLHGMNYKDLNKILKKNPPLATAFYKYAAASMGEKADRDEHLACRRLIEAARSKPRPGSKQLSRLLDSRPIIPTHRINFTERITRMSQIRKRFQKYREMEFDQLVDTFPDTIATLSGSWALRNGENPAWRGVDTTRPNADQLEDRPGTMIVTTLHICFQSDAKTIGLTRIPKLYGKLHLNDIYDISHDDGLVLTLITDDSRLAITFMTEELCLYAYDLLKVLSSRCSIEVAPFSYAFGKRKSQTGVPYEDDDGESITDEGMMHMELQLGLRKEFIEIIEVLKQVLTEDDKLKLFKLSRSVPLKQNQTIIKGFEDSSSESSSTGPGLYLLGSGEIVLQRSVAGRRVRFTTLGPGSIFGLDRFLTGSSSPTTIKVASEKARIRYVDRDRCLKILRSDAGLASRFYKYAALMYMQRLRGPLLTRSFNAYDDGTVEQRNKTANTSACSIQ